MRYDFNANGNLTRRADVNQNISERMTATGAYDAQNRLKTVERLTGTTVAQTKTMTYDTLGDIVAKSDITGTYNYTQTPQTSCPTGYTTSPGPHALRRTGTTTSNYRHYCYDKNGNQTRGWNFTQARQRLVTWKSYNMPAAITEASTSTTFSYGAGRERFRQVNGFASNETTIYVDGLFDRSVVGTTTTNLHYILAYGQAVAVFSSRSDGVTSTRYLHRDHLGSVTHVTNESGVVADTFSYDPWGKRRNSNWTDITGQPSVPSLRRPAFTGHENLQEVSLVHMNGRVYDPSVSHMLSADPFVQFPGDGQSHNRYSYVFNNPLRYTDPSGFCLPVYNAPSSFCNNPLAGSGLIGRGSSNPSVGTTQTVSMSARWGFNVSGGFNAGGGYCNGPGIADCTGTPQTGISLGVVQAVWDVSAVYTVTYAGLLAGDSGESAGGAMAAATVARYEHSVVGPSASPLLMAPGTPDAKQEGVSWSETAHLVLAGASIGMDATGIGAAFSWIPDLVDAGVSALEGDWKGAGMSLWGAIPIIGNVADTAKIGRILKKIADSAPIHHICTNKNCISAATGGPWTPRFEAIFEKAGMNLEDALNKIAVPGHRGPHPEAYHQAVFDRLTSATNGKSGGAYRDALQAELRAIGREIQAPGSVLNQLVTNP